MKNSKSSSIFQYDEMIYVVDFHTMRMWIHCKDDVGNEISCLSLNRVKSTDWRYRHSESIDGVPWEKDHDEDFVLILEREYEKYINQIVVGYARLRSGNSKEN